MSFGEIHHQRAGKFLVRASTHGSPIAIEIEHEDLNGSLSEMRLHGIDELYDLHYAVERLIAKVERS